MEKARKTCVKCNECGNWQVKGYPCWRCRWHEEKERNGRVIKDIVELKGIIKELELDKCSLKYCLEKDGGTIEYHKNRIVKLKDAIAGYEAINASIALSIGKKRRRENDSE